MAFALQPACQLRCIHHHATVPLSCKLVAPPQDLIVNLAPKKANWDLKREIQPKLDKLERRTLRALIEIAQEEERQRLEAEGGVRD